MRSIFSFLLLISSSAAFAQWNVNPNQNNAVCALRSWQGQPRIIADGNGGTYIAWSEQRKEDRPISVYVQHVNAQGQLQWTGGGVQAAENGSLQGEQNLVSDGAGGVIVTWQDYRNGNNDVYAQRLSASGQVMWTAGGVAICTESHDQGTPVAVTDGKGGVIISWDDVRNSSPGNWTAYGQHLDATGTAQWQQDGVALSTDDIAFDIAIAGDGSGGAIVAFEKSGDIYAQRVDAYGALQWATGGIAVCSDISIQYVPQIISDGAHGAVVAWTDLRHGFRKPSLYAQRINAAGITQWTADGALMHKPDLNYRTHVIYPQIAADGTGGVIGAWHDGRNGNDDIFAQRLNGNGQIQWAATGVAVCTDVAHQYNLALTEDGNGGAVIAWTDYRNGNLNSDIFAQQLTAGGTAIHAVNGLAISTAVGGQWEPRLAYTGRNKQVVLTWDDRRRGFNDPDIYATALSVGDPLLPLTSTIHRTERAEATLQLAPNPAHDALQVSHIGQGSTVQLIDGYGRVLRSVKADHDPLLLDIGDLVPGIYFIKAGTQSTKFIKQ